MLYQDDNAYPNDFNFPVVSFPTPQAAPDVEPDNPTDAILVEYSASWIPVLLAAASQLKQYASWDGGHSAQITAVNRAELLLIQLQNPIVIAERDYPTPFWDDETTANDEAPQDTQEWYGRVPDPNAPADQLTWQQDAVIWLLTGFVAIAGTPGAAIFFRSIAPRFVLAFDRGNFREVWRIVIDAADYGTVDTDTITPGEVLEVPIDGLADAASHDILIVRTV